MRIVTAVEMLAAEKRLFATGVGAEALMDSAGLGCARAIRQFFPKSGYATLFCGKGNNAGDALVIGRWLREWGWKVDFISSHGEAEFSQLTRMKCFEFRNTEDGNPDSDARILVDGLLGIGTSGPLRGKIGELAEQMNRIREGEHATTFAVDMPTGVGNEGGVFADFTLSICEFKSELVEDSVVDQVGRLVRIPLPEISEFIEECDGAQVADGSEIRSWLPVRSFGDHKGKPGRVAIVAGSRGLSGAAVLCGVGALRGGAGLVSVFVEESIYPIVAAAAPPELMVRPTSNFCEVADFQADVLAIGPGLGDAEDSGILDLILKYPKPAVIDADGLNWLSRQKSEIEFSGPRLLTPHPGEMARLVGDFGNKTRHEVAEGFSKKTNATVLLKGSRSVISETGQPTFYNSTGHPGMATGGIGDVLTGLTAALIAQSVPMNQAAILGSWLIGRAAEIAIFENGESAESLSAGTVASLLGAAFTSLKQGNF